MEINNTSIIETGNYLELVPLFTDSGLEVHMEGDAPADMITCWKAETPDGAIAGGISIELRGGEFVIGDIAVREDLRSFDLGTALLKKAMARIDRLGGSRIYLAAKAPLFFEKFGFRNIPEEQVPEIFFCKTCEERGVSCHPEFMIWNE